MVRSALIALLLLVPLLLAPLSPAAGQGADGDAAPHLELTLDETIGLALQNNRSLLDARLARTLQAFALDVAGDRYRPTASIGPTARAQGERAAEADVAVEAGLRVPTGGRFTLRWSRPLAGEAGIDSSGTYSLGFTQPLLKGFGVAIDTAPLRIARLSEEINELAFRQAIADVVVSTIRSWRALVRARRQLQISEASLARAREQAEVNRKLIEAGQMAAREILQSEADIAERELGLERTRNAVTVANFVLIDILDLDTATVIRPVERPTGRRPAPDLEESIETALSHSPGYARAVLEKEIAAIDLDVAENDMLWDLSLETEVSRGVDAGRSEYAAGLRLTVPLWDRSPELGLTKARGDVQRAERGVAEQRQSIGIAVRQSVNDVLAGQRRTELARRARALAEEKLEIERSKLGLGLSSTFQLTRFEDDLVRTQNAEVDAVVDYENALTALNQTLGTTLETWDIRVELVGR